MQQREVSMFEKTLQKFWTSEERVLKRCCGTGEDIKVIFAKPLSKGSHLPLVVWAHGGGMNISDCYDSVGAGIFKDLASVDGCAPFCWVSVQYRLAPENQFPAAVDDVISVVQSLQDDALSSEIGYSVQNIHLAGISAGAYLMMHAASRLGNSRIKSNAMLSPMVDPSMAGESHKLYGDLSVCPIPWLKQSWKWLLADEAGDISETRLKESSLLHINMASLTGVNTLLMTGDFDCFKDECLSLREKLLDARIDLTFVQGKGSHVGCIACDKTAKAAAMDWLCRNLRAEKTAAPTSGANLELQTPLVPVKLET
jgi:acetyl esterase/lipase